ncbi:hypothetical protein [Ethanoligenens sp.]|uniref:hypothetical protein n=1 Tax=Ethanoligenens sp. TaxID=2099655 RepID=UPI0039E7C9D5
METITFRIAKILKAVADVVVSILCVAGIILGVIVRGARIIAPVAAALGLVCLTVHAALAQSDYQWVTQCNADYRAVTSMHLSQLKQGEVIDLSRYQVDLNSSNSTVVKILANGSIWAASTGTATVLVTNKVNGDVHETIPIAVVDLGKS